MDERLGEQFQSAFWAAKRAMAGAGDEAFQRHGVRSGQQWILRCLWEEDALTPGEVARRLELSTPTVTKGAMRMESTGLLVRKPDPNDARLVRLHLTERGRELDTIIKTEMRKLGQRALDGVAEEDALTLVRGLLAIRKNLQP